MRPPNPLPIHTHEAANRRHPLLLLTITVRADDFAERMNVATKIVEVLTKNKLDDETLRKMCKAGMEEEAKKRKVSEEEWKLLKKASDETIATITREQLVEAMAKGYAARLSLDELKGVLAIYESHDSPAWKALQREQAGINAEA